MEPGWILDCHRVRGAIVSDIVLKLGECGEKTGSISKRVEERLGLGERSWSVPLFMCLLALCLISS